MTKLGSTTVPCNQEHLLGSLRVVLGLLKDSLWVVLGLLKNLAVLGVLKDLVNI